MPPRKKYVRMKYGSIINQFFLPLSFEWQPNVLQGNKCGLKSNYIFIQSKFTDYAAVQVWVIFPLSAALWGRMQHKMWGFIKTLLWVIQKLKTVLKSLNDRTTGTFYSKNNDCGWPDCYNFQLSLVDKERTVIITNVELPHNKIICLITNNVIKLAWRVATL